MHPTYQYVPCLCIHFIFYQCCGSRMFIPDPNLFDPGSRVTKLLDPGSATPYSTRLCLPFVQASRQEWTRVYKIINFCLHKWKNIYCKSHCVLLFCYKIVKPGLQIRIRVWLFTFRIRILLLIKVMQICDHWSPDPPGLNFESPRLHCERPRPSAAPFWVANAPWF
jgi:hypothetical protein